MLMRYQSVPIDISHLPGFFKKGIAMVCNVYTYKVVKVGVRRR